MVIVPDLRAVAVPTALVAGLCVDTPHFVLPPELRYQPLPLAVLGIAFSKSASTGAAAFTLPVVASAERGEGGDAKSDDDDHGTLTPGVSLFRFAVASEQVATTCTWHQSVSHKRTGAHVHELIGLQGSWASPASLRPSLLSKTDCLHPRARLRQASNVPSFR